MHEVFRDWMYARKARRQGQIQEYLIEGGGDAKFGSEVTVERFCDQLRKQRRPLVSQRVNAGRRWCGAILLCEPRRTDHRRVHKQARTRTGFQRFTKIGQIFHNKYIFNKKNFPGWNLENGLDKCFIRGELNWPISHLNDSETQERGLIGVKIQKISWGSMPPYPLEASALV